MFLIKGECCVCIIPVQTDGTDDGVDWIKNLCLSGFRYSIFQCVHRQKNLQVSDTLCDSSSKPSPQEEPCNLQPCPAL